MDAFDFSTNMEASYRVKIEGRLLDDSEAGTQGDRADSLPDAVPGDSDNMEQDHSSTTDQKAPPSKDARHRLSHFFKALSVDFDRSRFRNGAEQSIEWKKPESLPKPQTDGSLPPVADFDELTFKRNGDENMNVTINLYRHESPERYQLSPALAEVVDMSEATQQEAVMGLWEYIRYWGLQEDEEKRNFRCDELLKRVSWAGHETPGSWAHFLSRSLAGETWDMFRCLTSTWRSISAHCPLSASLTPFGWMRNSTGTLSQPCTTYVSPSTTRCELSCSL